MKKNILIAIFSAAALLTGCDDVLERPQLEKPVDQNFWRNEMDVRLHANSYYPNYFVGYNTSWGTAWAMGAHGGYTFNDDVAQSGKQSLFENSVPDHRGSTSESASMLTQYAGANWNFRWVRNLNVFQNRLQTKAKANLSAESFDHWWGVSQFLKGYEYCRLVHTFGDVPWFEFELKDSDKELMYKDRDSREFVMDKVYELFADAMTKIRKNDGANMLNRYVAAGFISRFMLFEGTWQKYHNGNTELAKKYLKQAVQAAEIVREGGYEISGDFRSLFCSQDLKGHKEVLMYRHYAADKSVTHHQASYSNGYENQGNAANLALANAFICQDGTVFDGEDSEKSLDEMVKTRDSRFEASFATSLKIEAATLLYVWKFCPREAWTMEHPEQTAIYGSMTNTNDAPIMRYSEVLLNWIEAKAELASLGEGTVTQSDIDASINELRHRPLAIEAKNKGVKQTADMKLASITADFAPDRDKGNAEIAGDYEVEPLIWEIRRERRMEMVFEEHRLLDLKRWKKLHYMDNVKYPETMLGLWINMKEDYPSLLEPDKDGKYVSRQVINKEGKKVTYDGSNADEMVGFYVPLNAQERDPFSERSYCSPIGRQQINDYNDLGFKLSQTKGW